MSFWTRNSGGGLPIHRYGETGSAGNIRGDTRGRDWGGSVGGGAGCECACPAAEHRRLPSARPRAGLLRNSQRFAREAARRGRPEEPIYSDRKLAPPAQRDVSYSIEGPDFYVSPHVRQALVPALDIRFIHTLSEGRAARLIAEKIQAMRGILATYQDRHPQDWSLRGGEILPVLTRGDKYANDPIRVTILKERPNFPVAFLLNGHRRMAALYWLAANGEIPLGWLHGVPVLLHTIPEVRVSKITARTTLDTITVLNEIRIDGISPTLGAMALCKITPWKQWQIEPYREDELRRVLDVEIPDPDLIEALFLDCSTGREAMFVTEPDAIFQFLFPYWMRCPDHPRDGFLFEHLLRHPHLDTWALDHWPTQTDFSHGHIDVMMLLARRHPRRVKTLLSRCHAHDRWREFPASKDDPLKQCAALLGITLK